MSNPDQRNNQDEITYRGFREGDEKDILDLFNHVFNRNWPLSRWTWENKNNPYSTTYFNLAINNQKIIGQSGAIPLLFNHDGETIKTTRVQNVMVHPDFRKRGIFFQTLKNLTEYLKSKGEDFIITFPNDNSFPAFMKLDYHHLFEMFTYNLSVDSLEKNIDKELRFDINEKPEFNQEDRDFMLSQLKQFKIFNNRGLDYLNWRYNKDSTKTYSLTRVFRGEKQVGLVVSTPYFKNKDVDLAEFLVENNKNTIESTLNSISKIYQEDNLKSFKIWSEEHYPTHQILINLGFKKTRQTHVVCKPLSERTSRHCNKADSYYLSMGDSDVY